jgi:NADPH-dependent 2,4-dienoyl-CoA reductase/sulfur reductase-like enzyme
VLRLRSSADGQQLRTAAEGAGSAVVIGSGFIGCEAAVSLAIRGLDVTVLSTEELPQLERLGRQAAGRLAGWLAEAGVRLVGGAEVTEIRDGHAVHTGEEVHWADLILSAAGVVPNSELARRAGLLIERGRIVVDEHLTTRSPGVYAAGDVALAHNAAAGRMLQVEHWGEALKMGEVAGTNAAGSNQKSWNDVPGFWSGIGERTLKYTAWGDGYDHDELIDHPGGGFTIWYSTDGATVGVLTHQADDDYELGQSLIAKGARPPTRSR